jgi:hypothetical protein
MKKKGFIKGPPEGTKGIYLFLVFLATTKAGTDSNKRMVHGLATEDAKAVT